MKKIFLLLLIGIIFLGIAGSVFAVQVPNPLGTTTFSALIQKIIDTVTTIIESLVIIMVLYAGILFVTSGGSPAQIDKAKHALLYAIIGAAVILAAKGIIEIIKSVLGV